MNSLALIILSVSNVKVTVNISSNGKSLFLTTCPLIFIRLENYVSTEKLTTELMTILCIDSPPTAVFTRVEKNPLNELLSLYYPCPQ